VLKQGPKSGGDSREYLEKLANIIVSGINLAVQIKRATKTLMMLHDITGATLSADRLKDILQGVEMLKAIEIEFKTKKFMINQWVILMNRNLGDKIGVLRQGAH